MEADRGGARSAYCHSGASACPSKLLLDNSTAARGPGLLWMPPSLGGRAGSGVRSASRTSCMSYSLSSSESIPNCAAWRERTCSACAKRRGPQSRKPRRVAVVHKILICWRLVCIDAFPPQGSCMGHTFIASITRSFTGTRKDGWPCMRRADWQSKWGAGDQRESRAAKGPGRSRRSLTKQWSSL